MMDESEITIEELWAEHEATPFPGEFRGKGIDGIDFVMLDADIAGCVTRFLSGRPLSAFQLATLGLAYRDSGYVISILNERGQEYFWRLHRLAELVLREVVRTSQPSGSMIRTD
jgi:hypothetical protein